jgi:hypothetical protein
MMKVRKSDVAAIVKATFPNYKGRKFAVRPSETVMFTDLNYSGGTRNQYRACTLEGEAIEAKHNVNAPAPWHNPFEGKRIELPAGNVIVEHAMFCGQDCGLTIYVNPADMPRMLPTASKDVVNQKTLAQHGQSLIALRVEPLRLSLLSEGINVSADCIATALGRGDSEDEIKQSMRAIWADIAARETSTV